jgi:hypothetical protein
MADKPTREFGQRRPAPIQSIPHTAPGKRSSHVALLLMGTLAVGGGAAAFMPRSNCQPTQPGVATPSGTPTGTNCQSRGSSFYGHGSSSGGVWSRSNFFSSDSASNRSSSGASDSNSGSVSRGGFGSFARAMSVHFSGGG